MDSPIQKLPAEILAETFSIVAHFARQTHPPTSWMQVLLVCRYWNEVACGTASLWSVIHVNLGLNWLRLCLLRCARSQLDIYLHGVSPDTANDALKLVIPHAARIRALHLTIGHFPPTELATLFATGQLSALEELSVLPASWRAACETTYDLSAARYPHLRVLALGGVAVPREPPFFAGLRVLKLHEHCCATAAFTLTDLFAALSACAGTLEELDLSRFEPQLQPPEAEANAAPPSELRSAVHLSHLQRFYMTNTSAVTFPVLKRLRIPALATLHVRAPLHAVDAARLRTRTVHALAPPTIRPVLDSAPELAVRLSDTQLTLTAPALPPPGTQPAPSDVPEPRVSLVLIGLSSETSPPLSALITLCPAARLERLTLAWAPRTAPAHAEWAELLGAFPALVSLHIVNEQMFEDPVTPVLEALAVSEGVLLSGADAGGHGKGHEHGQGRGQAQGQARGRAGVGAAAAESSQSQAREGVLVRCPALQTLHLSWNKSKDQVNALEKCLSSRARCGARLSKLVLQGKDAGAQLDKWKWRGLVEEFEVL